MTLESGVILIILAVAAYMFVRRHRRVWATGVLPLMIVPLCNIIYSPIGRRIALVRSLYRAHMIRLGVYVGALAVTTLCAVLFARRLPAGKARFAYLLSSLLFAAILAILFWMKLKD